MRIYSNNKIAYELMQACVTHGVKHVVISPGSRNAPLTLSFARNSKVKCYSIVDERSAAFFALGIAQQLRQPVALVCTSGTAVLNYAAAVAEAYYQNIPLVVISADRPKELINQAEGQAILQENILNNVVERSFQLPSGDGTMDISYARRLCGEAIGLCLQSQRPVHLNIPFSEPLYDKSSYDDVKYASLQTTLVEKLLPETELLRLKKIFDASKKVVVVIGFMQENKRLNLILEQLANKEKVIILTETVANFKSKTFYYNIDRLLSAMEKKQDYTPDLLITCGGTLVSKMLKQWLREYVPKAHWHLNDRDYIVDTFQCLTENITLKPEVFFEQIFSHLEEGHNDYSNLWNILHTKAEATHKSYVAQLPWSDFQAFDAILNALPQESLLQLGNSTVVRYHQLFPYENRLSYASNRGTSGIDGCTSTAVGAAYVFDGFTTLITGDISFAYDSNALWHSYISPQLRIIVINNGGGGIFRFLEASSKQKELEQFFETSHSSRSFKHWAAHNHIAYEAVDCIEELKAVLYDFYRGSQAKMLEIKTPQLKNAQVLRDYFKAMKQ